MPDPFVKLFARSYIAGDSVASAVATAVDLHRDRNIAATLDLLGEESQDLSQIDAAMTLYRALIDAVASEGALPASGRMRPSVSLKPSTFTLTHRDGKGDLSKQTDTERCYQNIAALALHAKERGIGLTVDMEDHAWVDVTLDIYRKLLGEGLTNVGAVLQSMLFRTKDDIASLPASARVRIVIGIYREPASIAHTIKRDMKRKMVEYAEALLDRGAYVEFGTHDEEYVFRFLKEVVADRGVPAERFEVQMLLGVPRRRLQDDIASGAYFRRAEMQGGPGASLPGLHRGALVRLYVPFATSWGQAVAYCRRRLNENPHIVWFGLKNLVTGS